MGDNFATWKEHFIQQARGLVPHQRKFYRVSLQHGKGGEPAIKMVSPTQEVVERAKSNLNDPPSVYDPVSGVMQHTEGKHVKVMPKRKRKSKPTSKSSKYSKKRKKVKSKKKVKKKKTHKSKKKRTSKKKSKPKKKWWT